ncbi:ABC transporter ATP-binding protein [bacterium]|nr:ABC transporter ATP-binding protein [bacterium]
MIKLQNISYDIGSFLLKNISFELKKGEIVALVGPSGAGKSVLLEIIAGLIEPKKGEVTELSQGEVALIFQDYMLFPHLNLFDNIGYGLKMRKKEKKEIEKAVKTIAKELSIDHLLARRVTTLSGGEKQRASLARALVVAPKVLLLDEPTAALDVLLKRELHTLIKRIHKEHNQTIILVTHDFREASLLADRVVVLDGGRVVQIGTPKQLKENPTNEFVAAFTE